MLQARNINTTDDRESQTSILLETEEAEYNNFDSSWWSSAFYLWQIYHTFGLFSWDTRNDCADALLVDCYDVDE